MLDKIANLRRLKPRARWTQFSLGTIFVITTILCVWLAAQANRAHRQRAVVPQIWRWGGSVKYDFESPEAPLHTVKEWVRPIVGEDFLGRVVAVKLSPNQDSFRSRELRFDFSGPMPVSSVGPAIDDERLRVLAQLRDLAEIDLSWTDIADSGVAQLATLANLRRLNLFHTDVGDRGMGYVGAISGLQQLNLACTLVSDDGIHYLNRLDQLEDLNLQWTTLTDSATVHLGVLTQLTVLRLEFTRITDAGFDDLHKALPNCEIHR